MQLLGTEFQCDACGKWWPAAQLAERTAWGTLCAGCVEQREETGVDEEPDACLRHPAGCPADPTLRHACL